ncbi:hypothetical protein AVEN_212486-1 [Araneus ventricosus]|uniref:Uncharacterized protein n=1 Tax=Araneus ventricosus TaxID=182803 RepID=A0A4Y2K2N4_ARAVE|nr:hypothetical protein AVEN_212486-1 [Araneus ventricosus]
MDFVQEFDIDIQGDSLPVRQTCRGHKDDSESHSIAGSEMPSTRVTVKGSKEKEQKQHVSPTEIILMTSFIFVKSYILQKVFEILIKSSHTDFISEPHGFPNVDSWHVSYLPGSY